MAARGSTRVIVIALGANFAIACAKFAASAWTGSSAMLSEAIHSLVDTSNQALLLHGTRRAHRPADERHPFGYSKELFFWSFVVAILLFSLGAGVAIYEGVEKLLNPHPIRDPAVNYVVLGVAIVLESVSTYAAVSEFNARRGSERAIAAIRSSKDPALFTILLEDVAALVGLLVALAGIAAAHLLGIAEADGVASIAIGLVLASVAAFIAIEVKALLIGEAASPELQTGVRQILTQELSDNGGHVRAINEIRTMQLGADDVLVAASIDFADHTLAGDVEAVSSKVERAVRQRFPEVRKLYIEVQSAAEHNALAEGPAPASRVAAEAVAAVASPASAEPAAAVAVSPGLATVRPPNHPSGRKKSKGKGRRRRR